jgi:hypothetical protein
MKGRADGQSGNKKQNSSQKLKLVKRDEDGRRKQATPEELEKMKRVHTFLEALNKTVDPFTTDDIVIALSQVSKLTNNQISEAECSDLFNEFIVAPPKHRKSMIQIEFIESKRRVDLVSIKDGSGEETLASKRFDIYHQHIPPCPTAERMLNFLQEIRDQPPKSRLERRAILKRAREFEECGSNHTSGCQAELSERLLPEVMALDPPNHSSISTHDKLTLLKAINKHLGEWDKICREFKDRPVNPEVLKHHWRLLKATMRQEVAEIKRKYPQYHYIKWLRAAIRKLEHRVGRRTHKIKAPPIIDATQAARRVDMLNVLAIADGDADHGIQGVSNFSFSAISSFKKYERKSRNSEGPQKVFEPFSLAMTERPEA